MVDGTDSPSSHPSSLSLGSSSRELETEEEVGFDGSVLDDDTVESSGDGNCEDWLEKEDALSHSIDFQKDPIWILGAEQVGFRFFFFFFHFLRGLIVLLIGFL